MLSFFFSQAGKLDLAAAARIVLRDWSTGKLSRYAVPPAVTGPGTPAKADAMSPVLVAIYEGNAALLEKLPPRKEMRRTRDLVRLSSGRVDDRTLALDASWLGADGVSDSDIVSEDSGDLEENVDDAGLGVVVVEGDDETECDGLEDDENDEDENKNENEVPQTSARKRKRPQPPPSSLKSQSGPTTRPRKKVAFATSVKATTNSNRPRSTSSSKDHTLSRPSTTGPSPHKKSNAKVPAGTKPPPHTRKSAANAPPPRAQKRKPEVGSGEDDAYDFGKFF